MSLDVYLKSPNPVAKQGTGIFMRIDGATRELTLEQAREYFPDANVELQQYEGDTLYHANITSNLRQMATAVQLYECLWRPDEIDITHAHQLIKPLQNGLNTLLSNKNSLEIFNDKDGWGTHEQLCDFVYSYLKACYRYPDALVKFDC